MQTFEIEEGSYIELNKLLKILRWVGSGGEANQMIENGEVIVNGNREMRKRNKLKAGDIIDFMNHSVEIKQKL